MKHPGSPDGIMARPAGDGAMPEKKLVKVRAKLESMTPDRTQWKPYSTTLTFDNVFVDIEVPAELVSKEGSKLILEADGVSVLIDVYATAIEEMNTRWTKSKQTPNKIYDPTNYHTH